MTILVTNWSTVWLMTGLGIGTVFVILIVLFCVLSVFSSVTRKTRDKVLTGVEAVKTVVENVVEKDDLGEGTRDVAIATAVYLYMQGRHDEESGIITIHHPDHPLWHAELNQHL